MKGLSPVVPDRPCAAAIDRYREFTGWKAPAAGGPPRSDLTDERKRIDKAARERISRELGHERQEIVRHYCG